MTKTELELQIKTQQEEFDTMFQQVLKEKGQLEIANNKLGREKEKLGVANELLETQKKNLATELTNANKVNETAIHNEYNIRQENERTKALLTQKEKENLGLKTTLDQLSELFNQNYNSFKDMEVTSGVFHRTVRAVLENLDSKIALFNNPKEEVKQ
jgi:hypothetical protein